MRFDFVHPNCIEGCWCRFLLRVLLLNWELVQHNNILSRALSFNHVRPSSWWGHIRWNLNVERLPVREVFCSGFGVMETQNSSKGQWPACVFELSGILKMGKVQGVWEWRKTKKSSQRAGLRIHFGTYSWTWRTGKGRPSRLCMEALHFPTHIWENCVLIKTWALTEHDPLLGVLGNNC